ncbi:MAG: hypothetical protein V3T17_08490, partial [Pseudomonadales bacterium]
CSIQVGSTEVAVRNARPAKGRGVPTDSGLSVEERIQGSYSLFGLKKVPFGSDSSRILQTAMLVFAAIAVDSFIREIGERQVYYTEK